MTPGTASVPVAILGSRRIPELDGVRGLAMSLVLVWHYLSGQVQTIPGSTAAYLMKLLSLTWSGVDLFFVLSGFLIAGILLDNRTAPHYFRAFYVRRICRIFPLYYLMLAIFGLALFLGAQERGAGFSWLFGDSFPLWSYATYLQNFHMASSGDMGPNWMAISWSLAVEEQFYLVLPLLILVVPQRVLPVVLLILVASAPVIRGILFLTHPEAGVPGYLLLFGRWDALFLGVLGAWILRQERMRAWLECHKSWLLVTIVVCLGISFGLLATSQGIGSPGMTFGGHTVLALLSLALILLALVSPASLIARCLRNSVLVWVGTVSYGIYLFHQPISGVLHALLRRQAPRIASVNDALTTLIALGLTASLAAASWRWLEKPIVRHGQRVDYGR